MLKRLLKFLFPLPIPHEWVVDGIESTCSICGQVEEFDPGTGMCGGMWFVTTPGDPAKHDA